MVARHKSGRLDPTLDRVQIVHHDADVVQSARVALLLVVGADTGAMAGPISGAFHLP